MQVLSCCRIRSLHHGFWLVAFTKKKTVSPERLKKERPFINLTLDLGYFDLEIVVHSDRLTLIGS